MSGGVHFSQFPVFDINHPPEPDFDFASGAVFLVNKPKLWSSFRVVKVIRKFTQIKKTGHSGTLDPMATGVMLICTGKATKSIETLQELRKTYKAEILFGSSTPSLDAETEIDATAPWEHLKEEEIKTVISNEFIGKISQTPPMYSALKVGGKRLYKIARKGEEVLRQPRIVQVYRFEVLEMKLPKVLVEIECSKGTYIRTITDDLGKKLNSLAHLSGLERSSVGDFKIQNSLSSEYFTKFF